MAISNISNNSAAASAETASPFAASQKGADKDTFLKLLVAQLKNQDPLNPQDGAAFVTQLAQFNSVEQLVSINDRLGQLVNKK